MLKFIQTISFLLASFAFNGCSEILEPVVFEGLLKNDVIKPQEEVDINVETLNFENALKINKNLYPRKLMVTGSGSRANVFDEADFLRSDIPANLIKDEYRLGYGDKLSFISDIKFKAKTPIWPASIDRFEYTLGIGDQLTFIQTNDLANININIDKGKLSAENEKDNILIESKGIVGSNGNVLLLGIGNVKVKGRTLSSVRAEVRNILIRNGVVPNFQLEISKYKSKRAFISKGGVKGNVLLLNNIPRSLQEVALENGLSLQDKNSTLITLNRGKQNFRYTSDQLLDNASPKIYIQNEDQISINYIEKQSVVTFARVGFDGNILLPEIGKINVIGRKLSEVNKMISANLIKKDFTPTFQLEITEFNSKKIYFVQKDKTSMVIPLTNFRTTLKDVILTNLTNLKNINEVKGLIVITLKRDHKFYRMTLDKILDPKTPEIFLQVDDQIEIQDFKYKAGQVFALSGNGQASIVSIEPSKRETLANIIFSENGVLNNLNAKRSEIYLLRGINPTVAYHLDAQNVSRILVAAKTELRPNDIIYAADRPIISFSRVLNEITPLRLLLRDLGDGNIP
jgi:protein involved in polysaccharide export with SLBB domain